MSKKLKELTETCYDCGAGCGFFGVTQLQVLLYTQIYLKCYQKLCFSDK